MIRAYKELIGPIKSRRTFEEVSERLKQLIFDGSLKPGDQLPSENELAQLFKVGRQSVREALRVLEITGFIKTRPGVKGGAVIENTLLNRMASFLLDVFKFHRVSLEDCVRARKTIEIAVLEFVLKNADQDDIENLRKNIAQAKANLEANRRAFQESLEFHRILTRASKNYAFCIVIESLLAVFSELKSKISETELQKSRLVVEAHEGIVDAIVNKNRKRAIELLERDLAIGQELTMAATLD